MEEAKAYHSLYQKIGYMKELFDEKILRIDTSTILALNALEKRLEGMNEFREQLKEQESSFVTRDVLDAHLISVQKQIDMIKEKRFMDEGRNRGIGSSWAFVVGGIALVSGLVALVLNAIRLFKLGL